MWAFFFSRSLEYFVIRLICVVVILTKITRIKQPLYTLAAFSSLTGGSKIGDYLRGLGVLRGWDWEKLLRCLRYRKNYAIYLHLSLNITMIPLLFPQLQKDDHARLKMIMSSYKKYQSLALEMLACAAVHCQPPPGIVNWSLDSND